MKLKYILKINFIFLSLLLLIFSFTSCNKSNIDISLESTANNLKNSENFTPELQKLNPNLITKFTGIDNTLYSDIYMLLDTSKASTEQILIVKANDNKSKEQIIALIDEYKKSLLEQYKDYVPEEIPKLNNSILKSKDLYILFIVAPEYSNIENTINKIFK